MIISRNAVTASNRVPGLNIKLVTMSRLDNKTAEVVRRATAFYQKNEPGHFLICVQFPVDLSFVS